MNYPLQYQISGRKAATNNFYNFWYGPIENRIRVYAFISRRSILLTTDFASSSRRVWQIRQNIYKAITTFAIFWSRLRLSFVGKKIKASKQIQPPFSIKPTTRNFKLMLKLKTIKGQTIYDECKVIALCLQKLLTFIIRASFYN